MQKNFKAIIIGSGPGGAVCATLLAERGLDVLLIEAGGNFSMNEVPLFSSSEMNFKYKNGGITPAFGAPPITYVEGACVGGGSEVNSGLYHRLPAEVLEKWEKQHGLAVDKGFLEKTYEQIERDIHISFMPKPLPTASMKLQTGADKLGWAAKEIPRWYKYDRPEDPNSGTKQSMSETFIPRFLKAGGTLLTRTEVLKFEKNGSGWDVHCTTDLQVGEPSHPNRPGGRWYTCENLFLAAGSTATPTLLLRSGFQKGIGKTLSLHPTFKFAARFPEQITDENTGVPVHQVKQFSPELSFGCSISSKPYIGLALNDTQNLRRIEEWRHIANYYTMICPEGLGRVRTLPFFRSPLVSFSLTKKDQVNLRRGYRLLARLLFEAGATELFPSVGKPISIKNYSDLDEIDRLAVKNLNLMTIHLFCSVPMGGSKTDAPLDSDGRVREARNLFVVDGSALCTSPSVNPQGSIMAFSMMNTLKFLK